MDGLYSRAVLSLSSLSPVHGRLEAQLHLCFVLQALHLPLLHQPLGSLLAAPPYIQPQRPSHPGVVFNTPLPPPLPSDSVLWTYQNTVTSQIRCIFSSFFFFLQPKFFEEFYFNRTLLLKLTMLWPSGVISVMAEETHVIDTWIPGFSE